MSTQNTVQSLFQTTTGAGGKRSTSDVGLDLSLGMSNVLGTQGQDTLKGGLDTTSKSTDYWGALLGGDKEKLAEATEPERYSIGKAYQAGRQAISMGPRGGGTSASLAESRFSEAGDVGRLVEGQRADAAKNVASTGLAEAGIGASLEQTATQNLTNIFQTLMQGYTQFHAGQPSTSGELGSAAGGIIAQLVQRQLGVGG